MVLREALHKLVDSLPDGALQPAEQMLMRFQTWPPVSRMPPELDRIRDGMPGRIVGFGGGGHFNPKTRTGSSSQTRWDGDTRVVETRHYHHGHLLDVTQSIRWDQTKHLIYKHGVQGPDGKSAEHEITFELDASISNDG